MRKLAIYFSMMEEEKRLQNLFLLTNVLLFAITFISLILALIFSIPNIIFLFSGTMSILLLFLQSRFVINYCNKYVDREFKKLYLKFLDIATYYQTAKECPRFKKVRKNILVAKMRQNERSIKKGFAYLKEWQSQNMMYL